MFEYPAGWSPAAHAAAVPGLSLSEQTLLVPKGDAVRAGLLVGTLARDEIGPLPAGFLAALPRLPSTQIVNLLEIQAYKYALTNVPGFPEQLTIFAIPNPSGDSTVLACYAPATEPAYMRSCEQTVAGITLVGQSQAYELTPEPGYASGISGAVSGLDRLRVALKRELRPQVSAARAREIATRLAGGFATAASSLATLQPSFATQRAQTALSDAILSTHDGYVALASAAARESASAYTAAQKRIAVAEASVNRALESFALLGYSQGIAASTTH